ncbi:MAG TPA: methyltransferase domain-containing protein [Pyrinomonadaceae bacterium]|nr:methyltransferase domain-containing protein [Pyrinomonadaceae bacterium]
MAETIDSEIDVEQLMSDIRAAVAKREAEGRKSLSGVSIELESLLSNQVDAQDQPAELPPIRLQPCFVKSADDHYHVNNLLKYHDHIFIWNAYRAILKREPDGPGLEGLLEKLRSGRFNKIDVLAALRFSPEGRSKNVQIDGLARPAAIRKLYRVPVLGYLLEMIIGIARLPAMLRSQRQFEEYAAAQDERLAGHMNRLGHLNFRAAETFSRQVSESLSRKIEQVAEEHRQALDRQREEFREKYRELAELQQQQAAMQHEQAVSLWREQREIIGHISKLRDELTARLLQFNKTSKAEASSSLLDEQSSTLGPGLDDLLASFTEHFRGSREEIKESLRFYLPILKSAGISRDVLDIGCGRGEWLELLKEEGIEARGLEINHALAEQTRSRNLEVIERDALRYLRELPPACLNAVTGFHVIEHLSFETLVELLDEICRTLRPDGLVIFETPNPKNLVVGACNFYSDPTHLKPLFPETIQFIMSRRGFQDTRVEYLNPSPGSPFKDGSEISQALDSWFYSPRDFAVIARKMKN